MKHHLRLKKAIAFVLAMTMTVTVLTSCDDKDESSSVTESTVSSAAESGTDSSEAPDSTAEPEPTEEEEDPVTASAVKFLSSGKYTTTVKAEDPSVDLSSLSKDNVEVTYIGLEKGSVVATPEITEDENGALVVNYDSYADGERITSLDDVKKNDDGSWSVSFTDENAVKYGVSQYYVRLKDQKMTVPVDVDLGEMKVTPDITEVSPAETEIKVTLTLEGGEFADKVEPDMISVSNAFEKMEVESISASGNNMTMLLSGNVITYGKYGAYLVGTVAVAPEAVKDCAISLRANIGIADEFAGFDASTLKVEDGKVTVDFKAEGSVDLDKLTKDNIKIDGITVEKVEKKDDTTAAVTMSAKDIKTGNDFVKLVADKEADFGGFKTSTNLSQVSFYPVFDYCETDGDNLKMVLKMYAYHGTFDKDIKADAIKLGMEFENGKAESITISEDGSNAECTISVPANGQKEDDFEIYGDIILPVGSMNNNWGEKNPEELSYDRVYSNETIGKAIDWSKIKVKLMWDESRRNINLTNEELQAIQDWTRGKNTWYGSIFYWAGSAGSAISAIVSVYSGIKSCLEFFGVVKSDHQMVMDELQEIKKMLSQIDKKLDEQRKLLINLEKETYRNSLEQYEIAYSTFLSKMRVVERAYKKGAEDLKRMGITLSDTATEEESKSYNRTLMNYIFKRSEENGGSDPDFGSFKVNFEKFRDAFNQITGYYMGGNGLHCPLEKYDKLYALMFNFDTQSYASRFLNRVTLRANLTEAIPLLATRYQFSGSLDDVDPDSDFGEALTNYNRALETLESREVYGISPEDVAFGYQEREVDEKVNKEYISDLMLFGFETLQRADYGCSMLDSMGYIPIDCDLNKHAGGYYIYLGYKTTENYDEAIKGLTFRTGKGHNDDTFVKDGIEYKLCPVSGMSAFTNDNGKNKNTKGDLNCKAGGDYIFLYYTKEETPQKTALANLYINGYKQGSVGELDMNRKAGGDDLFLHTSMVPKGGYYIKDLKLEAKKLDNKTEVFYDAEKSDKMKSCKVIEQNLNQGSNKSGGYHIYLGYETIDNYNEGIKDIRICSGTKGKDSFVYEGRTYKLAGVSDSVKAFADSKGDLNFNGSGNITEQSLYIYYTYDKLPDNMGVTTITFDNVGENAVCDMNLNSFVGGDVIYMHLDRQDQMNYRRMVKIVGSDPNYHPYSYVLGGTVNYVTERDVTRNNLKKLEDKALGSRAARDWTDNEIKDFIGRMEGRSFGEEFEEAGIPFKAKYFYMKISDIDDGVGDNVRVKGDVVTKDSHSMPLIDELAIARYEKDDIKAAPDAISFSIFELD